MVVGRTLWDFIIEVAETPGLRWMAALAVALIGVLIVALLMMVHSGLMDLKVSYGGIDVALH